MFENPFQMHPGITNMELNMHIFIATAISFLLFVKQNALYFALISKALSSKITMFTKNHFWLRK